MNADNYRELDNPVWYSLITVHKDFALGTNLIKRYTSGIVRFLGFENPNTAQLNELESWASIGEEFYIVGDMLPVPSNWSVGNRLDCNQMIYTKAETLPVNPKIEILELSESDRDEMFELVNSVQPGFFQKNTPLMGSYFGIKEGDKLVAIAGERLRMTGFTEISAVCTYPSFTGKGFAKQLISYLINKNIEEENIPFLHVLTNNKRAINIYELLGFTYRKSIPFWKITLNKYIL